MNRQKLFRWLVLPALAAIAGPGTAQPAPLPNPILSLTSLERYSAGGKTWIRHRYDVLNKDLYPAAMFAAAPELPPCGANAKASRSWVDFYEASGKRVYGFCAFGNPPDLSSIWFATEEGTVSPKSVYIEITDRQTNTKYKSNLAATVF
jgi:hypothetical protein